MFRKVLIANRGEVAVRIIRALRELGIQSVAVYSTADAEAQHVKLADEAVCVGGPQPADSYLNMQNIVSTAILTGAEAIHPDTGSYLKTKSLPNCVRLVRLPLLGLSLKRFN